jgi:hypothetical protein
MIRSWAVRDRPGTPVTRCGMPFQPLGEPGGQAQPLARTGLSGRRRGAAQDVLPAADRRLVRPPGHGGRACLQARDVRGLRAGPRFRRRVQCPDCRVQVVAAVVAVARAPPAPAVSPRGGAGVRGGQHPVSCFPGPGRRGSSSRLAEQDDRGLQVARLGPAVAPPPGHVPGRGAPGHHRGRRGQQPHCDGQRHAHPVAVTAQPLLPFPAGLPGLQGLGVVEVPGRRGGQQTGDGAGRRAASRG